MTLTLRLSSSELEALKRVLPAGVQVEEAADQLISQEIKRRYKKEVKAGAVLKLEALKRGGK